MRAYVLKSISYIFSLGLPRMPGQAISLPVEDVGENVITLWIHAINRGLLLQNGSRARTLSTPEFTHSKTFCVYSVPSPFFGL